MKRTVTLLSIITLLAMAVNAKMNRVVLSQVANPAPKTLLSGAGTIYVIQDDINFNGATVNIGANSILQFDGGTVNNAKLVGRGNDISAMRYQIFNNTSLSGLFAMKSLPVEWFGAKGDGTTDDSRAINQAIQSSNGASIEMGSSDYFVASTININKPRLRLDCIGSIRCNKGITVFNITESYIELNVKRIHNQVADGENVASYSGTAILFSDNSYHPTLNIQEIWNFDKGIALSPKIKNRSYSGIQYAKITFQLIRARYGLYFNSGHRSGQWINENQFFGGRLMGQYGIYVEPPHTSDPNLGTLNGNVFYSIGFEGLQRPISLYAFKFCSFHDLRMSEFITDKVYIDLTKCEYLTFDIKSIVPYSSITATDCMAVEVSRCFTDTGLGIGARYDKMYIDKCLPEGKIIASDFWKNSASKSFYYDINSRNSKSLNFNDLLTRTWEGQLVQSNSCKFTLYDKSVINIDFANSCYKLHPQMMLNCSINGGSSIRFVNGSKAIKTLTKSGTYIIVYDGDDNIRIEPINM